MADRVTYAIVKDADDPRVLLATEDSVMSRLLAMHVVAATPASEIPPAKLGAIRDALLEERWADAVGAWIEIFDTVIDVFADEEVISAEDLDEERAALEIRVSPIFRD